MKVLILPLVAILALLSIDATAYRLPTTVRPISYIVHLNLSESTFTDSSDQYEGYVVITLYATEPGIEEIQLHASADYIDITSVFYNSDEITNITVDESTDIVTLGLVSGSVSQSSAQLFITYTSRLSTSDMYGFYKSSYTDENGVVKYLATTQFQPTFARRVIPSFDEPAFKATFEVYLTYPIGLNALSNMPGEEHDTTDIIYDDPNLVTSYFPSTGILSTYLVAFIVSDFTCTQGENIELNAVPYQVCSRSATVGHRDLALDAGVTVLRAMNNFFPNLSYGSLGFPKMDQVAIPDFAAGAMENWGLVTYREQFLLWDDVESTNIDQQNVATIIAHEYAHQWFGNLVTMEWWAETFLNEGFANYFQYFATHEVYPDWELDKQYIVRVLLPMLETDSLDTAQPLQYPANSDGQVMARFGRVSYFKGGSIFRMVEYILGRETFFNGLGTYLATYAYQNTLPDDLWNILDWELEDRSRLPLETNLSTVMRNWVEEPGYPILDVTWAIYSVVVRQEGRFLLSGTDDTESRWYVPITWSSNLEPHFENTTTRDWLLPIGFVEIPLVVNNQLATWVVLNNQVTGFYRVNYNDAYDRLIGALEAANFSGIPEINRAAIVDDAFHLARANRINYTRVFGIVDFLKNDVSHHAWFPAISGFNFLLIRVGEGSRLGRAIGGHILDLLTNIYASVPWTSLNRPDHAYTLKQVDILSLACRLGLSNCVNFARERFGEFRISGIRPTQNLRSIVYCNALRHGNSTEDWHYLWDSYSLTEIASERVTILSSLGCIQNEEILWNYLHLSLDESSGIRPQDALSVFTSVYTGSTLGIEVAFKFLQENHHIINDRYQSLNALTNMINGLAERFTTDEHLDSLIEFLETGELTDDFHSAASAALETARTNIAWISQHVDELYDIFGIDPNEPETTTTTSTTPAPTTTTTLAPTTTTTPAPTTTQAPTTTPEPTTPPTTTEPPTTTLGAPPTSALSLGLLVVSLFVALREL